MLRKALAFATSALTLAALPMGAPVQAQAIYCTNCATVYSQTMQYAAQAEQLVNQAAQLQQQIQQYQNMVQNTAKLPQSVFGDALGTIQRINNVFSQAKGLAYSMQNLDQQFSAKFKGLNGYMTSGMSSASMQGKYQQWSDDTNDNILNVMKSANMQASSFDDEAALMQELQSHAQTADGQMQALGVGNELSVQAIGQLQKLRQLMLSQIQLQAIEAQTQQDRDAANHARAAELYKPADDTSLDNGTRY